MTYASHNVLCNSVLTGSHFLCLDPVRYYDIHYREVVLVSLIINQYDMAYSGIVPFFELLNTFGDKLQNEY